MSLLWCLKNYSDILIIIAIIIQPVGHDQVVNAHIDIWKEAFQFSARMPLLASLLLPLLVIINKCDIDFIVCVAL